MSSFPASALPLGPGVRVLTAHDTGLIALEKPGGVLSHPNGPGIAKNALLLAPYDLDTECYHFTDTAGVARSVWLLNRLDSPTSGVLLVTTDGELAKVIKDLFSSRHIDKTYHAVVKGARITPPAGEWSDLLKKSHGPAGGFIRAAAGSGGSPSVTIYFTERTNRELPGLSLLRMEAKTGRTHQLRVQSALHGHPILGDKTYGDFAMNKNFAGKDPRFARMFLHCSRTAFRYPWAGGEHKFVAESPLPEAFTDALGGAGETTVTPIAPKVPAITKLNIRLKPKK
jgi:tRNA pseudouridine65 synthase